MRPANENLASELLEAGKSEFLAHGFLGASLRSIASSLGVTTGAIYRYYPDKEAFFDALVSKPADEFLEVYRNVQRDFAKKSLQDQLNGLPEVSEEGHTWMMEYVYDNFDAFKLIVCCSQGTRYEHYIDTLVEIEATSGRVLTDRMLEEGYSINHIDDELIHIVSSALFYGMFETVRHDMPREKAFEYMNNLKEFYSAGWFKLLELRPE